MRAAAAFALVLSLWSAQPADAAGFMQAAVPDPGHPDLAVGIWYPSAAPTAPVRVGPAMQLLAAGAPVVGTGLPVVVISHGTLGSMAGHRDTAAALADAGFIVAAPTHSGDNSADDSLLHSSRRYTERARQVSRVLDWLLAEWPAHGQLDAQRVGIFGFSAGALTALIEVGARPDFSLVAAHCAAMQDPFCTFGGSVPGAPATRLEQVPDDAWPHETRFRAAVAAAPPMGFALNVAAVHVPVQLWRAEKDEQLGYPWHAEAAHAALSDAEYRVVPGASHMAFVAPCPPQLALPSVCGDPPGFDRAAFHASLNAAVVEFFKRTLTPD